MAIQPLSEADAALEEAPLPREVYTLLASANLLRIRGRWDDAVENCMAAMRLAPASSSAQSLLGDIYENQGRLDDAIQWYHMALDIHPNSPADRIKLARALENQQRMAQSAATPPARREQFQNSFQRLSLFSVDRTLRLVAILATLLAVSVVVFALIISPHRLALLGLGPETSIKTSPVVLATTAPPDPDAASAHDPVEQTLLNTLRANSSLTAQGVTVNDVQWDPRTNHVTLTVSCAISAPTRLAVLQAAMRALEAAAPAADPATANLLSVRCLLGAGSSGALVFFGDLPRANVPAGGTDPATLASDQLQSSFSGVWWSPQVPQ